MTRKKSRYRASMTQTEALWETINRGKLTPEQLQDEIDYSASSLKRAGLDGESGAGFNLRKLIPLMKAQDDYTILEHLAHHCGFLLLPIPRGGRSRKERVMSIAEYQKLGAVAVETLARYIENGATEQEALDHLHDMLKGTAGLIEDVKAGKQIAMNFEE